MHIILVIISDIYFWKVGLETIGENGTRIALIYLLVNRLYNETLIRCFSNSLETVAYIVAFYYFLKCKNKFNKSFIIMTLTLSLAFMIRNTSVIVWPVLGLIRMVKDSRFV